MIPPTIPTRPPLSPLSRDSSVGQCFPPLPRVVMVTALSVTRDDTQRWEWVSGFSDFWSLPWIITQRLRGGWSWLAPSEIWLRFCLLWYMEAAVLATLHCSRCTLFLSTEITVLVYVGRTQGRGNYSIMVHGEFSWLGGDQKFTTTNLKASFNKEESCAWRCWNVQQILVCVVGQVEI